MAANRQTRARKKLSEAKKPSPAEELLKLAEIGDFFHSPDGRPFVTVPLGKHGIRRSTFPVRSKSFREWLAHRYYRKTGKGVADKSVQEAISTLAARALHDGEAHEVYCRVGGSPSSHWLDLGNDRWQAVSITAGGWGSALSRASASAGRAG